MGREPRTFATTTCALLPLLGTESVLLIGTTETEDEPDISTCTFQTPSNLKCSAHYYGLHRPGIIERELKSEEE